MTRTREVMHTSKTAIATHVSGSLYDVTYIGASDLDSKVPYSYLEALVRRGYNVKIGASPYGPASTIEPGK